MEMWEEREQAHEQAYEKVQDQDQDTQQEQEQERKQQQQDYGPLACILPSSTICRSSSSRLQRRAAGGSSLPKQMPAPAALTAPRGRSFFRRRCRRPRAHARSAADEHDIGRRARHPESGGRRSAPGRAARARQLRKDGMSLPQRPGGGPKTGQRRIETEQQRWRRQLKRTTGQRVRHRRGSRGALTCQLRRRPGSSAAQAAAAFLCRAIFASGGGPRRRAQGMAQGRGAKAHRRVPGPAIPPSLLEPSCSRRPPAARPVMHRRPGAHCGACRQVRPGGGINVSRPLRLPSDCVRRTWASPRLS